MKLPERISKKSEITVDAFNQVVDLVHILANITVAPGLERRITTNGIQLALSKPSKRSKGGPGTPEACTGGDLLTLSFVVGTQDSDAWARTSGNPVKFSFLTDVSWDSVNGKIVGRFRELTLDKCGIPSAVGAEGDLVNLVSTESCAE